MIHDPRIQVIEVLRILRKVFKYKELEDLTGLTTPTLWRYINMKVLPTRERARELLDKLVSGEVIKELISRNILIVDNSMVNIASLIYDVNLLKIFSLEIYREFSKLDPTAVMTVEVDGIPLAVVASDVLGAKLVVAKRRLDVGVFKYYEVSYVSMDPPSITNLYIPSQALEPDDRVLIVDDLLRSGRTSQALIKLVRKAGASIVGLYALVAIGSKWRDALRGEVGKIYVSYVLNEVNA